MSVAQNSHLTNKPEADGVFILHHPTPPPPSLMLRYLKLLKATWEGGKKSKEGFEVTSGNQTEDLAHRRPCTNQLR